MLRRVSACVAVSLLLLAPACKKKTEDQGESTSGAAADSGSLDKQPEPAQPTPTPEPAQPTPTPEPVAPADSGGSSASGGAGGSGGGAPAKREDLTCDPLERGACLEGEQCIGAQGCDAVWTCDATIVCQKGVKEYCGCDGRTFEAVYGNCPWKKYEYAGPCK